MKQEAKKSTKNSTTIALILKVYSTSQFKRMGI